MILTIECDKIQMAFYTHHIRMESGKKQNLSPFSRLKRPKYHGWKNPPAGL